MTYASCDLILQLSDNAGVVSDPDATFTITVDSEGLPACDPESLQKTIAETQGSKKFKFLSDLEVTSTKFSATFSISQCKITWKLRHRKTLNFEFVKES